MKKNPWYLVIQGNSGGHGHFRPMAWFRTWDEALKLAKPDDTIYRINNHDKYEIIEVLTTDKQAVLVKY